MQLELDLDIHAHLLDLLRTEMHLASPLAADFLLDFFNGEIWQVAGGAPSVPAEAEEVGILPTVAARVPEAHASAAAVTGQRPFEEVTVLPAAVSGDAPPGADFLYLVPSVIVDDGFVRAVVDDAAVHDLADVVWVAEHPVHLRIAERATDVLQCLSAPKAPLFEQVTQLRDAGLTFGVQPIRPADMFGTVGIDHDAFHLAPLNASDGVEVAKRRHAVCAATLGFLGDTLLRLVAEVGRVVLGHPGHDRMLELASRSVIDVFGDGDERSAGVLDSQQDGDIIGTVTSQTIELVHDHITDLLFTDEAQHLLKTRAIC